MMSNGVKLLAGVLLLGVAFLGWREMAIGQAERKAPIPAPAVDDTTHASGHETAVFAGGCFWGVQSVFNRVKGVTATTAGYSGGAASTATYDGTLLRIFFSVVHDPTQLNRQGPDVGTSYRSVIFYTNEEQHRIAAAYIAQLDAAHVFPAKIVTQVVPLKAFYNGEDYHQDYADKNPNNPYIQICDVPKIAALKAQFPELFHEYNGH
jgi:peptide-methionine (S)-S-oxide reductase